jgi:glucans biosynthesis protein C
MASISATPTVTSTSDLVLPSRDASLDYLKATLVLIVVAHHSCLAYTTFAHFDPEHYLTSSAPVVDTARWPFFDYSENFGDVFFMSLMFFISGLFVWPSLRRSGVLGFLQGRLLRLGVPFVVGVGLLMPLAYYASWQLTGRDAGYLAYWRQNITMDGWPPGPLWFIWLLLLFDILAAGFFILWPRRIPPLPIAWSRRKPLVAAAAMFGLCALVYLPSLKAFGFQAWGALVTPPLYFQLSRFGLYLVWFACGVWLGRDDLERGLLARDGALARHWPWWIAASFIAYNALMLLPFGIASAGPLTETQRGAITAVLWVVSCVASCFAFLALFRGAVRTTRPWMDSLSRTAYVIYLVHYAYVLWLQRALMDVEVHASLKFLVVFSGAALCTWVTARGLLAFPLLRRML